MDSSRNSNRQLIGEAKFHESRIFNANEAPEKYKSMPLQTLSFPGMDSRLHSIVVAHQGTCDWIFQTEEFQQWISQTKLHEFNGVLWIKGKPGAGKSTLMKHILLYGLEGKPRAGILTPMKNRNPNRKNKPPNYLIAAYFFNARGTRLEKSRIGMLRSLLYQLADQSSEVLSELQTFLHEVITSLAKSVFLLVDALDECDEVEVRNVVSLLEGLSSAAACSKKGSLSICLSSRHYPNITMTKMLEIIVERWEEHTNDIIKYVQSQLKIQNRDIEIEILRKANGVFMWIILVVEMLNMAWENGDIDAVWMKLREVPGDLDEIFRLILEKDNPNISRTTLMLQLLLFKKGADQFSAEELYYGVLYGSSLGSSMRDNSMLTDQVIERFIITTSRGLIEVQQGLNNKRWVQFIHQTVNDFLLRNQRLQTLGSELTTNFISVSHHKIVACCLEYIRKTATLPKDTRLEPASRAAIGDYEISVYLKNKYPFLKYAVLRIFDHAEDAQAGGVGQEEFLRYWQNNPEVFELWKAVNGVFDNGEYNKTKGVEKRGFLHYLHSSTSDWAIFAEKPHAQDLNAGTYHCEFIHRPYPASGNGQKYNQDDMEASLLYVLCWRSYPKLVETLLSDSALSIDVNARGGPYVTAMGAAVACIYGTNTTEEIIHMLLKAGADCNANCGPFLNVLQAAVCQGLLGKFERTATVVSMLIDAGADVNAQDDELGNALQVVPALVTGNTTLDTNWVYKIIIVLLKAGADINAQGGKYGSALQVAVLAAIHNPLEGTPREIFRLLRLSKCFWIPVLMSRPRVGYMGGALQAAAASVDKRIRGRDYDTKTLKDVIEILLNASVGANTQDDHSYSALRAAVNTAVGIRAPLFQSDFDIYCEILDMLFDSGVIANTQSIYGCNALQAAAAGRDPKYYHAPTQLLEMLLERGAECNLKDVLCTHAVDAAFRRGCVAVQVLEVLLSYGAVGAAEAKQNLRKYDIWARRRIEGSDPARFKIPSYDLYKNLDEEEGSSLDSEWESYKSKFEVAPKYLESQKYEMARRDIFRSTSEKRYQWQREKALPFEPPRHSNFNN
ncbi:hypothetical protein TWF191_010996 [Orbilia oligospora]|uniref:NACHT domain-containing protein n=1 Tax=Orbilia oligospora TaxID=2813651 RepID=A0A7C8UT69_ORBOL|nr:hypothetical protein TWF191_010996 [Orbilia oligospora]